MQRSLWLAHRLAPQSAAYHLVDAYRVSGSLDTDRLDDAFRKVVRRRRLLRSSFVDRAGDVVQEILPPGQVDECFAVEIVEAAEDVEVVAVQKARRPFDLSTPPLIRLVVIQGQPDEPNLLMLVLHHILADEQALGVFWGELSAALDGRFEDERDAGPAVQFDDFVHWQREERRGDPEARGREIEAWRERLDPPPDELALPFERGAERADAVPGGGDVGRLVTRPLSPEIGDDVRELARNSEATPFFVYAFAYRLLLGRLCEGRAAFASPVSTRFHPATGEMIGYFTNPVVMPIDLDESLDVSVALRAFRQDAAARLAQASVPFQELVEELDPPRARGRHPVFQTLFVLRRPHEPPRLGDGDRDGEVELEPITLDLGVSKFDLTLFVTQTSENAVSSGLELSAEYRTDLYDEASIVRLLSFYETTLQNLVLDAGRKVADLSILGADEIERLGSFSQGPELSEELELLPRRIFDVAEASPTAIAIVFEGRSTTYGELADQALRLASRLVGVGVEPGHGVGLNLSRSAEAIAAILAIHRAGAAYVPLDPTYPAERNRDVLADAEVSAVVTTSDLATSLPEGDWVIVPIDALTPKPGAPNPSPDLGEGDQGCPGDPAYLLYTSGSTGRPKGVVVSQENLRVSTASRLQAYGELGVRPGRFLLLPSLAFDSSVAGLFWALSSGSQPLGDALVIPTDDEARDPRALVRVIERDRVTSLLCVPSLYAQILRFAEGDDRDPLSSLEAVIVAGEACPWALVREHFERLPGVRLFNEYGPTEATVWSTLHEMLPGDADRLGAGDKHREPVPIGRPIPGVRMEVEDAAGRPVPIGVPGQAWVAGPTVTGGYRGRPDLTAERFDERDGVRRYRTGDRMAWTEDGRLLFLGREDEQIKLRGFRIEPGEIESALLDQPGVEQATVVARRIGSGGSGGSGADLLVAFGEGELSDDWREHLAKRLPAHMVPARLVVLDELPKLPNGKIDRHRLREMPLPAGSTSTGQTGQAGLVEEIPDDREQAILSLWQGLLVLDEIRLDDNFFELGGHSLQVAEMALAIERDFGVTITASDVFQHPTVRSLAGHVAEGAASETEPYEHLFPIQPSGRGAPCLVCVPHFFSSTFAERFRGERPVYGLRGVSLRQGGNLGRWPTMRHLADDLVAEVERRFPEPPAEAEGGGFLVAGYSFGGSMAVEMVRAMLERGLPVRRLFLITPMPLDFFTVGPHWGLLRLRLQPLRRPASKLTTAEALGIWLRHNDPRTLRPYRAAWRWLKTQPLRHALARLGRRRRRKGLALSRRILHADVRVERFRLHRTYRPGVVQTPTTIFNAEENAETPGTDSAATWRPVFRDLEVVPTPDPHLDDEAVESAKRLILDRLQEPS